MKLVIVAFIREVNDTGQTNHFDGNTFMDSLFRVQENELDPAIQARILSIIKFSIPDVRWPFFVHLETRQDSS